MIFLFYSAELSALSLLDYNAYGNDSFKLQCCCTSSFGGVVSQLLKNFYFIFFLMCLCSQQESDFVKYKGPFPFSPKSGDVFSLLREGGF